jgi:hypothetical protein
MNGFPKLFSGGAQHRVIVYIDDERGATHRR